MFDIFKIGKYIKSKFNLFDFLWIGLIVVLYFATRLINLDKLPIFTDEGIYIHWAKVAWHNPTWRFISLTDGRQPLQTWVTIPLLKLFPNNALLAGRLFAVSTGFLSLIGIFVLVFYLFGKKPAYIATCLYLFTPYFLFYDRLALMDSGVNTFFIWILFLSIVLIRTLGLDTAIIFGITSGIAMLTKSSIQLFMGLAIFGPILLQKDKPLALIKKAVNYLILLLIGVVIALTIYNVQRLSPFFHYIAEKNNTFIYTIPELIKNPFNSFWFNLYSIPYYVLMESAFFIIIVGLVGWFLLVKDDMNFGLYLTVWTLAPYIILCFVAKVMYPRYIIFFASLFSIYFIYFLISINKKNRLSAIAFFILFLISVSYADYCILFNYKNLPFPDIDRGQYITGGSSGYGVKEIIDYARILSRNKPVRIVAEGTFGMSGDVLDVFIKPGDRININSYWPLTKADLIANQPDLVREHVLVVYVYQSSFPSSLPLKLIKQYDKPGEKSAIHFFELTK